MERSSHSFKSPFIVKNLLQKTRGSKRYKKRVTFRSHSLRMQTKEEVLQMRSEKVLCYCSQTHYGVQNQRNLTRQNNETTQERE